MQMLRLERPVLAPQRDIHGGQGECVDTGAEIRGHGRVYLSVTAVKVAARTVGCTLPEEHEAVLAEVARLEAELAGVRAELELARPGFAILMGAASWLGENQVPQPKPVHAAAGKPEA